MYSDHPL